MHSPNVITDDETVLSANDHLSKKHSDLYAMSFLGGMGERTITEGKLNFVGLDDHFKFNN